MGAKLTLTVSRMEGASNAKCRLWRLRLFVDGKPAKSKRFHGTYGQAKAAGDEFKAAYAETMRLSGYDPDMTFTEYAERWLQRRRDSGEVQYQTLKSNEYQVRRLDRTLGDVKLSMLSRSAIVDALAAIKSGADGGSTVSGATLQNYYKTLNGVLGEAVYDEVIAANPCDNVRPPKSDTRKKKAVPFADYMRMLSTLEGIEGDARAVAVLLISLNGFRRSEVVALEWDDDLGGGIAVRSSIEESTGRKKSPKTENGVRVIPMTGRTRALLDRWKAEQASLLKANGIEQTGATPIIANGRGKRLSADSVARWWEANGRNLCGVSCTLHVLRHTFLTYLAADGNAFALKNIAGWSSISMANTYVHDDKAMNASSMQAFERRVDGTVAVQNNRNAEAREATRGNGHDVASRS